MTTTTLDREVERRLQDREVRYTQGRRVVVSALAGADGPRSADELHQEIGDTVPLSSLYRSLSVMEQAGVIVHHFGMGGITRYELAEWLKGHHHHLICVNCGTVEDLTLPPSYEEEVQRIVDLIGAREAFTASDHALEIEGRCSECR